MIRNNRGKHAGDEEEEKEVNEEVGWRKTRR